MSVDSALQTALTPLSLPVFPNEYTGTELEYITTNYTSVAEIYASIAAARKAAPAAARYLVQVHYYLPHKRNPNPTLRQICRALWNGGFTWPGDAVNANDSDGQHYVLECEYTDGGALYG